MRYTNQAFPLFEAWSSVNQWRSAGDVRNAFGVAVSHALAVYESRYSVLWRTTGNKTTQAAKKETAVKGWIVASVFVAAFSILC